MPVRDFVSPEIRAKNAAALQSIGVETGSHTFSCAKAGQELAATLAIQGRESVRSR